MKLLENKSKNDWAIFRINSGKKWFATRWDSVMKSPDQYKVVKYSSDDVLTFNHNEAIKIIQSEIGMREKYGIVNSKGIQKVFDWRVKYPTKYDDVNNLIKEDVNQEGITTKGVEVYYKESVKNDKGNVKLLDILKELAYDGNLGFHEMHLFYNKASKVQIKKLEKLLDDDKIKEAWELIQKVTGVKLKGKEFK